MDAASGAHVGRTLLSAVVEVDLGVEVDPGVDVEVGFAVAGVAEARTWSEVTESKSEAADKSVRPTPESKADS
jgi:hypothetical protein